MPDLRQQPFFATDHTAKSITAWIEAHSPEKKVHLYTLQGIYWNALLRSFADAHRVGEPLRIILESGETFHFTPTEQPNAP